MRRLAHVPAAAILVLTLGGCAAEASPIGDSTDTSDIVGKGGGGEAQGGAAAGGEAAGGEGAGAGQGALPACVAQPACDDASKPVLGPKRPFSHLQSRLYALASPEHRGRDMIYADGDAQWLIGKFAYGLTDKDLEDEEVDVFVERGCGGTWEKLGTTRTTDGATTPVEGVSGSGRAFFRVPDDKALGVGRHRVRFVVAGDQTSTDLLVDVVPKGTKIVVSDVDGTLTDSETAEYPALLTGSLPGAQPQAADVLSGLAGKGYHVVYLTARPEWLTKRTHEFLTDRGFPPGVVHTTTGLTGAIGGAAASFKSDELAALEAHGHVIAWAFGNQPSDTDAYDAANVQPKDHRVFLQVTDAHGGRRIERYADLLPVIAAEPKICD